MKHDKMQDYFLGIDIGSASVGFAVTDLQYNVIKRGSRALWGVRLFEPAVTARERRIFRCSRRRMQRRKNRIELLQEIFAPEIYKVDAGFYTRLKESKYHPDDKRDASGNPMKTKFTLFDDSSFTDVDFHCGYETIYHLRNELIFSEKEFDVRLVYLALHHIIKHRGHFLFEGKKLDEIKKFGTAIDNFTAVAQNYDFKFLDNISGNEEEIQQILKDKNITKKERKDKLNLIFKAKNRREKELVALISGSVCNLSKLFDNEDLKEFNRNKVNFSDKNYDEVSSEIEQELQEQYDIILAAKALYDWTIFSQMLGDCNYLSEAKTEIYEKHKADLLKLKNLLRSDKEQYREMFELPKNSEKKANGKEEKVGNYSAYVGFTKYGGKSIAVENVTKSEFYKYLKPVVLKYDSEEAKEILQEIEFGTFLPKQVSSDNSVIPYQLHFIELTKILDNAKRYLPFLSEVDCDGISNIDKIKSIMTSRVPYYIGPVNTFHADRGGNSWAIRKEEGKIYPWNIFDKIDEDKSAEVFIRRMTNKCTYLLGKDVIPKNSLLYCKFMVLNELNNLKINDQPISVQLKQKIYDGVFKRKRKVTKKSLEKWLIKEGIISQDDEISGIDTEFKASLTSYLDFKGILTGIQLTDAQKEDIILNITLFGESKKLLKRRLKENYPTLTANQLERLNNLTYKGWGRLSKEFLTQIMSPSLDTGEPINIITALWETNENLQQLLSRNHNYASEIGKLNMDKLPSGEITYKDIDELYVSPAVKRSIWQTVLIVKEIEKIMGKPPKRIFIEMPRGNYTNKKDELKESRKKQLDKLYSSCKKEEPKLYELLKNDSDETKYRSDKLYLYYRQKGKCMYSDESISIDQLYNENIYDIDHIYPQARVMDNSLDNRVLVKRELNEGKSDKYPINPDIQKKMKDFWKTLYNQKFISKIKYDRLVRTDGFTDNELSGFISRQIVETSQSTKAVATILKGMHSKDSTEIVYSKAGAVSEFRHDFDLLKSRDINDYHHGKDAYLNIVVGNTYFVKFTKDAAWFIRNNPGESYNLKKLFNQSDIRRNGETAWVAGERGTIQTVVKNMNKNNLLFSRKQFENKGKLFKTQIVKKGKGQLPIKGSDDRLNSIEKYGAYNKVAGAYFILVESEDKKGRPFRSLKHIPIYLANSIKNDKTLLEKYCIENLQLKNPKVIIDKIGIDTLININGFYAHISGRSDDQIIIKNANQLVLSSDDTKTVRKISKFILRKKNNANLLIQEKDEITEEILINLYNTFIDKLSSSVYSKIMGKNAVTLEEKREKFNEISIEDKCVILYEILQLFTCNSSKANLSKIGAGKSVGNFRISSNLTGIDSIKIINQSITGFFTNEVDLKTYGMENNSNIKESKA